MPTLSRRKTSRNPERKTERLELRMTPSRKALIQRAMAVSGQTAGDLAYEGARRVIEDYESMVLVGADKDAFLAAVSNPPKPTAKLVAALKLYQKTIA